MRQLLAKLDIVLSACKLRQKICTLMCKRIRALLCVREISAVEIICARNHRGERAYVSSFAQDAEWKLIGH